MKPRKRKMWALYYPSTGDINVIYGYKDEAEAEITDDSWGRAMCRVLVTPITAKKKPKKS